MFIVHVHIHVKEEFIDAFIKETIDNARHSRQEPGIARFDFIQRKDDPTRFVLVEVYRDEQAPAKHKETLHYAHWRDAVVEMMVEARTSEKYHNIYPEEDGWG
jgi:quinol monooxygenase YgiN